MSSNDSNSGAAVAQDAAARFREVHDKVKAEVQRSIVGQDEVVEGVLSALFAGGHVLLEGVPGIGKTLLVRTLGQGRGPELQPHPVHPGPDAQPTSAARTMLIEDDHRWGAPACEFQHGPAGRQPRARRRDQPRHAQDAVGASLSRCRRSSSPSAERTIKLDEPFCVMATQNPVEQEGTYPLPEAQLDRFLFKLIVGYPQESDYAEILSRTTGSAEVELTSVSDSAEVLEMRKTVRAVPVPESVVQHAVRLVMATQPGSDYAPAMVNDSVALGSSPRGAQALMLAAKVKALLAGRFAVAAEDVRGVAHQVLRHRVQVNFAGVADGVTADRVVDAVLEAVAAPGA